MLTIVIGDMRYAKKIMQNQPIIQKIMYHIIGFHNNKGNSFIATA